MSLVALRASVSRAAVLRRREQTRFTVCERRRSRRGSSAMREQSTQKRGAPMNDLPKIIFAGVSTVALVGGIGAGFAYADTPSDEPTSSPTTTATSSPAETPAAEPSGRRAQNGFRKPLVRR